ncbi:hypothetical protein Gotur_016176 [Gossypium turneri]
MKVGPAYFILLCLFTAAFYLLSSSSSSSSLILLTGRRSLEMSLPHHKYIYPKAKVVDGSSWEGSNGHMDDEIVNYHLDYHGVTTHPTPTPKHPKP